jgi:hypothetical protein
MIRHIALFRWSPGATEAQKAAVASELAALRPALPSLREFVFGADAGLTEGSFDFAVTADFDDEAGYVAYRDDFAHREVIARIIAPIVAQRVAVQLRY